MTATAWDLAATTTVEDDTPEALATQRLPITYQEAAKGLLLATATAWDLAATTAVEDDTPDTLAFQLRAHLQTFATQRLPITYEEAAKGLLLATATAWDLATTTTVEDDTPETLTRQLRAHLHAVEINPALAFWALPSDSRESE